MTRPKRPVASNAPCVPGVVGTRLVFSSIILCSAPSFALVACAQHAETRFWATARSIRMLFPGPSFLFYDMSFFWRDVALYRQDMSLSSHAGQIGLGQIADKAQAPVVGVSSHWPSRSGRARHTHSRHQLMYSQKGGIHVSTPTGSWILPPTKSIWISGGIPHALLVKRPVELTTLWVARDAPGAPYPPGCKVSLISPLVPPLLSVYS